jgi:hypothetical protein
MAIETILAMRKENRTAITPVTNSSLTSSIFFLSKQREEAARRGRSFVFDGGSGEDRSNKGIETEEKERERIFAGKSKAYSASLFCFLAKFIR